MPGKDGSRHEKDVRKEYLNCYTYEPDQDRDECCGASGRKLRRICQWCPNFDRYRKRQDKEGKENEKGY